MKAIRRSIKGDRSEPPRQSVQPKSALAITPPKKVIKALYDYNASPSKPHELSFMKGDFFHVISREDDEDWYEAANPRTGARGLVPVTYFEVFGQTARQSGSSQKSIGSPLPITDSGYSSMHGRTPSSNTAPMGNGMRMSRGGGKSSAMVYGIVQYDFQAERPDELDAKAGEAIIVIAQSNPEWFVAKPIGRLGGPGLIPVSFIEIKDMSTGEAVKDPHEAVRKAGVPKVEEWKRLAADYKNSSITLGWVAENTGNSANDSSTMSGQFERMSLGNGQQHSANGTPTQQPPGAQGGLQNMQGLLAPVSASVPRFCFDNDKYWFIIECVLEDGSHWELSRYYQNFYDFQIKLLQAFPNEAGNGENGSQRILPYMPGPVTYVTEKISNMRRESLDDYVKRLLNLPPRISKSDIVKELFAPRVGDYELDPQAAQESFRLSHGSQGSRGAQAGTYENGNGQLDPESTMHRQPSSLTQGSSRNSGQQQGVFTPGSSSTALSKEQGRDQSQSGLISANNPSGALAIKCWWGEDLIKLRVPSDITYNQLKDKLSERVKAREDIRIQWQANGANDQPAYDMMSDYDLDQALERTGGKVVLYADYA